MSDHDLQLLAFMEAPIGLVLTQERVIKTCNRTFARMFGYQRDELIEQSFRMLYASHQEFEAIRDVGIAALQSTGSYSDERLMPRRDGSLFWCRVRVHTQVPDDPLKQVIFSFSDISDTRPDVDLTPRERQIVHCLAKGLTSKEIGRELGISPRTVEDHRARLLAKFKVRNIAGLVARLTGFAI